MGAINGRGDRPRGAAAQVRNSRHTRSGVRHVCCSNKKKPSHQSRKGRGAQGKRRNPAFERSVEESTNGAEATAAAATSKASTGCAQCMTNQPFLTKSRASVVVCNPFVAACSVKIFCVPLDETNRRQRDAQGTTALSCLFATHHAGFPF